MKKVFKIFLSVLILFLPAFYFGINNQTFQMGCVLVPSIISIVLINLEELKKSIVSIKTRDIEIEFKDAIEEAYATIEQLNKTKQELTGIAVELIRGHNKYGGCGIKSEYAMINSLYELNKENSDTVNTSIKSGYKQLIRHSYILISSSISKTEDRKKVEELLKESHFYKNQTMDFTLSEQIPSKIAITKEIENLDIDTASIDNTSSSVSLYDEIICKYQSIYNELSITDTMNK